jgi:hypothetical protein
MTDVLGPTFGDEVIAAGLGGLPFSWGPDGDIQGRERLTPEQNSTLDGVVAAHDPTKTAVPPQISDRQFYQALATPLPETESHDKPGGLKPKPPKITQTEALTAVKTGELPSDIVAAIKTLPQEQQFAAEMMMAGAGGFKRNDPMADTLMAALGFTKEQADDLWRLAATL